MLSFCAVFNCSDRADREQGKSNYCLPQIFRKYLTERKLEKTRTRIKKYFLPLLHWIFHTTFTISNLKNKFVFYPD